MSINQIMVSTWADYSAGSKKSPGGSSNQTSSITNAEQRVMAANGPAAAVEVEQEVTSSSVGGTAAEEQQLVQSRPQPQPQHRQVLRPPLSPFSSPKAAATGSVSPAFYSSMRKSAILSMSTEDEGVETDATTEASSTDSDGSGSNQSPISASGEGASAMPAIAIMNESHRHQDQQCCEQGQPHCEQGQQPQEEQELQLVEAGSGGSGSSSPSSGGSANLASKSPLTQFFLCCSIDENGGGQSAAGGASSAASACGTAVLQEPPIRPFPASCRACVTLWTEKTRERFERNIESLLSTVDSRRDPIGGGPADAVANTSGDGDGASSSWSRNFEGRYRKLIDGGLTNLKEAEEEEQRSASAAAAAAEALAEGNNGDSEDDNNFAPPSLPRYRRSLLSLPRNRDTRLRWMRRKMTMSAPGGPHAGGMGAGVGAVFGGGRRRVMDADASEADLNQPPSLIRKAQSFDDHVLRSRRLRGDWGGLTRLSPGGGGFGARQASSIAACQVLEDDCRRGRGSGNGAGGVRGAPTTPLSFLHLACECGAGRVASDEINGGGSGGMAAHFGDRSLLESDDDEGYDSDPESFVGTHRYSADILQSIRSQEEEEEDDVAHEGDGAGDSNVEGDEKRGGADAIAEEASFEDMPSGRNVGAGSCQTGRMTAEASKKENKGRGRNGGSDSTNFGAMDLHDAETMSQLIEEVMHTSMTLIWHPSAETPKNNNLQSSDGVTAAAAPVSSSSSATVNRVQPPTCVKAWIELGCRVKGQIIQPKLVWRNAYHYEGVGTASGTLGGGGLAGGLMGYSPGRVGRTASTLIPGSTGGAITDARQRGMAAVGVSSDTLRSVDVLDIARILTPRREIDRDRYPLAKTSKSFTIVTTDGTVHLFEVAESSERDRLVSGLKLLVARLASLIIVGDKRLFDDFFYPSTSSDFQRKFCGDDGELSYHGSYAGRG